MGGGRYETTSCHKHLKHLLTIYKLTNLLITMTISTLFKSGLMRGVAVAAICALGFSAQAQTFIDGGVIYKVNKGKVEVQPTKYTSGKNKGNPVECENGETPDTYTGDIVIPAEVTYKGVTYPVSTVAAAFKETEITSITLPDNVEMKIGRGGFQNCTLLTTVKLNNDLATIEGNTFQGCTALTSLTIPGTVKAVSGAALQECTALETIVIEDGETPISFNRDAFGAAPVVKNLTINRAFDNTKNTQDDRAFRGSKELVSLTLGGSFKTIYPNFFENCTALTSVTFNCDVESIDYNAFANTGIVDITLPNSLTSIASSLFMNCKSLNKVTLGDATTTINAMAFYNSSLKEINLPATLKTIGNMAFSGTQIAGDIVIPDGVTSIGDQAYANTAISSITVPASVKSIGTGAFMGCPNITKFVVAAENENYAASEDGTYLMSKDGETLLAYAPAATATEFKGDFKAVAPYAFYGAKNLTKIELPACTNWGDYSLYGSGIQALTIGGTVGRYVAANCPALAELTVNCSEIPTGIANNCPELAKVTLPEIVTIVRQDAFAGCPKVESLNLGSVLVILETDCFANSGIKALTVASYYPASMAEGVFTAESGITVTVPADLVDAYKAATGWSYLNIVGDANLVVGGENLGMPDGLYYAGDDNDLHCVYQEGEPTTYPINMQHTFQLAEFGNRIYGASAGKKFWYSASSATEGDGKLFYISKVDGNLFQAVVLDNAGNNAYKDPTGLYIYDGMLYVNDRNVCIRKISADALALPQDYPSWMENNWMPFYGGTWTYGCIKNGFAITTDPDEAPRYWVGMKYNGCGMFSFKDSNIGTSSSEVGSPTGAVEYLTGINLIATCFNIDIENNHMYMYIETAGTESAQIKGGLYRIDMEALAENPTPSVPDFMTLLDAKLIDGSPVKYEGNATNEHVGISQLAFADGYMYWCYRAPTPEEAAANEAQDYAAQNAGKYWWAEAYDETNPLHHSGIKRIKLGEENPVVEMVVPDVTGYGIVALNYEGSKSPDGVYAPAVEASINAIAIENGTIYAAADATVVIYTAAGAMVDMTAVSAGDAVATDHLAVGLYLVEARTAAGNQTIKFVK